MPWLSSHPAQQLGVDPGSSLSQCRNVLGVSFQQQQPTGCIWAGQRGCTMHAGCWNKGRQCCVLIEWLTLLMSLLQCTPLHTHSGCAWFGCHGRHACIPGCVCALPVARPVCGAHPGLRACSLLLPSTSRHAPDGAPPFIEGCACVCARPLQVLLRHCVGCGATWPNLWCTLSVAVVVLQTADEDSHQLLHVMCGTASCLNKEPTRTWQATASCSSSAVRPNALVC
jgi:hypothetical protein